MAADRITLYVSDLNRETWDALIEASKAHQAARQLTSTGSLAVEAVGDWLSNHVPNCTICLEGAPNAAELFGRPLAGI